MNKRTDDDYREIEEARLQAKAAFDDWKAHPDKPELEQVYLERIKRSIALMWED